MCRKKCKDEIEVLGEIYYSAKRAGELTNFCRETIKRETRLKHITCVVINGCNYYKLEWLKDYIEERTIIGTYRQQGR